MTSRPSLSPSTRRRRLLHHLQLAVLPLLLAGPLHAQTADTNYPAIADVDPVTALSRYLRMLAANPRDLASLTGAGRAALAVGDANAALGFYARAEEIAPRNGRIKAGLASALVQMEQPRAALKLFTDAVALGVPESDIAADRGLAYDLNGDGRRAQADYTLALRTRDDDETLRRLALSMAISGDKAGALTMLAPLLRRGDGGAVRARAFVLALTGDQAAAATAVRGALPGPQASVMTSFMSRLATLNPAQKALAVNFGYFPSDGRSYSAAELFVEQRRDPAAVAPVSRETALAARNAGRADAPLIPAGAALGGRVTAVPGSDPDARAPRRRPGLAEQLAAVEPPPHVLSAQIPGMAPVTGTSRFAGSPAANVPAVSRATASDPASISPASIAPGGGNAAAATNAADSGMSQPVTPSPVPSGAPPIDNATNIAAGGPVTSPTPVANAPAPAASTVPATASPSGSLVITPNGPALASADAPRPVPTRIATIDLPASAPASDTAVPAIAAATTTRATVTPPAVGRPRSTPSATARVTELSTVAADRAKGIAGRKLEKADAKAIRLAEATAVSDGKAKADPKVKAGVGGKADTRAKPDEPNRTDSKAGSAKDKAGKSRIDPKDKPDAADKADAKAKPNAKDKAGTRSAAKDTGKADPKETAKSKLPERYWVQVASGSNKANLDKAWENVKGKAPKLLDGRATYTAPWRASNRLLVGPFKTEEEAQAQVNKLAKAGVSGIQFTTRAGADVEKVGGR